MNTKDEGFIVSKKNGRLILVTYVRKGMLCAFGGANI